MILTSIANVQYLASKLSDSHYSDTYRQTLYRSNTDSMANPHVPILTFSQQHRLSFSVFPFVTLKIVVLTFMEKKKKKCQNFKCP